ncbi:MAG: hypothetical protein JJE04_24915 [Acidobacteriia bacterium]|nr:hypothetical protein [Terriglobia bacterium]
MHKEKEMLDSRKIFLALAVLMIASVSASAQILTPLSCVAQAAGTPSIRAEGVAEQVGDVIIICNGGTPAAAGETLRQVNIQVFTSPSINITSRLLVGSSPGATSFSEALIFVDEPTPALQTICGSTVYPYSIPAGSSQSIILGVCGNHYGTGTGIGTYDPATASTNGGTRGNVYQARQPSANSLIWQGIPFDPPGSLTSRILRITNVRVNASQLGVPAGSQASVSLVVSTSASGVSNPIALPITNPAPTVAIAQNSLTFSVVDADNCLQCENANKDFFNDNTKALGSTTSCDGNINTLRYQELFPSVFRRRNLALPSPPLTGDVPPDPISQDVLGFPFETESGFYRSTTNGANWPTTAENGSRIAGLSSGTLGLADHGTRLIARFNNVQNGIQIWVETSVPVVSIQSGSTNLRTGTARLVTTDPNGAGPFSGAITSTTPSGGFPISLVSVVGGTGSAAYEIVNADTTAIERVNIRVVVAYLANTTNNLPSLGASTANGGLAPISTVAGASASAPLPRFVDTATNKAFLNLNSCRSNILFPFVTNQAGFDTGLAISNTSKDPFGTSLQTGACTVNFYGKVGSSDVCLSFPSPSITGGQHFVWSLANGGAVTATAGFQGYVIAQCQFQYGHGYAFISDLGAQKLAQGYLALVMDDSIGTRTGSKSETLGH